MTQQSSVSKSICSLLLSAGLAITSLSG
ncbi:MAG: hypothetical protein JWM63_2698, partial [Gammaproteobacteria bacterium]|nr:hypothetical protein [Gammaproteobacteria bacterium]